MKKKGADGVPDSACTDGAKRKAPWRGREGAWRVADWQLVHSTKRRMRLLLILGTAIILLASLAVAFVLEFVFIALEVIPWSRYYGSLQVVIFSATSIIIGLTLAFILGRLFLRPINKVIDGLVRLADGDFSVRIDAGKHSLLHSMAEKFNIMASELEKNAMLRTDFVNEFTHELKTPIVSISGLIPLLKNKDISEQKRAQYLAVMETETARLVKMTENTLYLSKIETETILRDRTTFCLSEQIRASVLLLEKKWVRKSLSLDMDFTDYYICANEDMLKQVWINLIDNAVKFSREGGTLAIAIGSSAEELTVSVTNDGEPISDENKELIFHKFYQADRSRSTEGNGIGLAIVKHIIELHRGSISVSSDNGRTTFTVCLPRK